jgi:hypothetical protein
MADIDVTRREVLTRAAYMAPAIVTLPVLLSFASAGSGNPGNSGHEGRHKRSLRRRHYGWE